MNEEQIFEILSAFRDTLDAIDHKLTELDEKGKKVDMLEARLENEIIQPTLEKIKHDEEEADFSDFHSKYGDKLDKYSAMLKSVEGDDFDASREAWKGWKEYEAPEGFEKPESADGYIDAYINVIEQKISEIKEGLGLPDDAEVEIKADENGVEVAVEGEAIGEDKLEEVSEEDIISEGDEEAVLSDEDIKEIEEFKKEFKGWN